MGACLDYDYTLMTYTDRGVSFDLIRAQDLHEAEQFAMDLVEEYEQQGHNIGPRWHLFEGRVTLEDRR